MKNLSLYDNDLAVPRKKDVDAKQDKITADGILKGDGTGVVGAAETIDVELVDLTKADVGLGNVDNTSDVDKPISTATQTALNGKQATITGGASTITSTNLTANRALVSNANGKVAVSGVTSTELGYLDGVTSNIQTQLNGKLSSAPVTSVNNKTGAVSLGASDVGAVPTSRTVNNKALSADISLTASDVGAVPTSRTVNSKALSSNITLTASDVRAVPTSRTVNGKALSSNITLSAGDVSALPISGGTLTGNLAGQYITGTWLQTTAASDKAGDFATIDSDGWIYKRSIDNVISDVGWPTHQNLFDNGNFQIWQRYPSGTYTGVPNNAYIADRWIILSSDGSKTNTFTKASPCGIHSGTNGANCTFTQHLKNASAYNDQELTYSVLKSDAKGNLVLSTVTKVATGWTDSTDICAFFGTGSGFRWIGPGETVYGVKLELGHKQTLAHLVAGSYWRLNEIPPYATELLRCKRFFTQINGGSLFKRADIGYGGNRFQFFIPVGIEMVANPTASGTPKIYSAGNASSALTQASGFTFTYNTMSNGDVRIIATKANHGLTDAAISFDAGFQLSADV